MKQLSLIIAMFFSVLLGAGITAFGEKASVKKGKALFNDPGLGSTGSSCNTCHTDGRGLEKVAKKRKWIIGGKVHSTLEEAINYSITTGLRGNALRVESVEMRSLVLYIKSLAGRKPIPQRKRRSGAESTILL
jgi:mono/diheme cytochrome c family protein